MNGNKGINGNGGRMDYLDAFRGFSMVMVVFGHVIFHSLRLHGNDSYLNLVMQSFRMPAFFFISGFVAYKALERWNGRYLADICLRKFQAQIVGTAFFIGALYFTFPNDHIFKPLYVNIGAYWFTVALFRIFLIYALLSVLFRNVWGRCFKSDGFPFMLSLMALISVTGIILYKYQPVRAWWMEAIGYRTLFYLQFFTLGVALRRYGIERASRLFTGNALGFLFILFMAGSLATKIYGGKIAQHSPLALWLLEEEVITYLGIFTVFGLFYSVRDVFGTTVGVVGRVSTTLRYIGRRTLDIYFLHYFFLPDLRWLRGCFPVATNQVVTQLLIAGLVTAVVVSLCLGVSYIMRKSQLLGSWLFGVKREAAPPVR